MAKRGSESGASKISLKNQLLMEMQGVLTTWSNMVKYSMKDTMFSIVCLNGRRIRIIVILSVIKINTHVVNFNHGRE